jgi:hypothetical protein
VSNGLVKGNIPEPSHTSLSYQPPTNNFRPLTSTNLAKSTHQKMPPIVSISPRKIKEIFEIPSKNCNSIENINVPTILHIVQTFLPFKKKR